MQEKPANLSLLYDTGVGFSSRKNFANLGSFAKAEAVECRICNSLIEATSKFEAVSSSMSHMKKDNSNILTINTCLLVFYSWLKWKPIIKCQLSVKFALEVRPGRCGCSSAFLTPTPEMPYCKPIAGMTCAADSSCNSHVFSKCSYLLY